MWDVNGISGRRTGAVKMGNKSGAHGGISKVSFHHTELCLSVVFSLVKFDLLAFYRLELVLVCPIPIDISNNTRILEIDDGVVDKESGGRARVKNIEVIIFDPRTIEIGSGMCTCMKGDGNFGITVLAGPYKVSINADLSEGDISCHFVLPVLVEKNKWVLPRITAVVLAPPSSWMVRVIQLFGELGNIGNRAGSGGKRDGGIVCGKPNWFIALYIVI